MRRRKKQWLRAVALFGLLFLAPAVAKCDSRMVSLADPAFTHDIFGVDFLQEDGVPFLPNPREVLTFPHSVVSDELFLSHAVYLDFYHADSEGTGAVVLRFKRIALGLLHSRNDFGKTSWVIGFEMNDIDGSFSPNFYDQAVADIGIVAPEPPMPSSFIDFFGGINFGPVSIGLLAGYAMARNEHELGVAGSPNLYLSQYICTSMVIILLSLYGA